MIGILEKVPKGFSVGLIVNYESGYIFVFIS